MVKYPFASMDCEIGRFDAMESLKVHSSNSSKIFAEQVRLLYKNAPLAYSVTLVNAAILVFVQRQYISTNTLLIWYGCIFLVTVLRALMILQYNRQEHKPSDARIWNVLYVIGAALAGMVWGTAAIALFPSNSIAHQVFVAFVLAGMAAGGISVLAPRMEACLAFLLPSLFPLIVRYLSFGSDLHMAMGFMTSIFLLGMVVSALSFSGSIRRSLILRFDKRELEEEVERRRRAEEALFREKARLQTALKSIAEGVVLVDAGDRIEYVNPAAEQLCGWSFQDAANRSVQEVFKSFDAFDQPTTTAMEDCLRTAEPATKQHLMFCKAGKRHNIEELATPLRDPNKQVVGVVSVLRDVTKMVQKAQQLEYAAAHDSLTGLPNRNLLQDRAKQAIARAHRKQENFAMLYLDLDCFKAVNDSMGHASGDALLVDVAKRLSECVREEDTIARLGGDEFVVLLDGPAQEAQVRKVADKICHSLQKPYQLGTRSATVTVSIGSSLFPTDGRDPDTLLCHADAAMYRAKQLGRNRLCMYRK